MSDKYSLYSKEHDNLIRIIKLQFNNPDNFKEFLDEQEIKKSRVHSKK